MFFLLALISICQYNLSDPIYSIEMPHYNIYSSIQNGNSCQCPQMTVHGTWENLQWGKLYQPQKTKVKNNLCIATNCYSYGTTNLSTIRYVLNNSENPPNCYSGSDLRVYGSSTKNASLVKKVYSYQANSKKFFSSAINFYPQQIEALSNLLNSEIPNCHVEKDKLTCRI